MKKKEETVCKVPFKKGTLLIVLCVLALLFAVVGGVLSVVNIVKNGVHGVYDFCRFPLLALISVLVCVLVVALLIKSEYTITKTHLFSRYGIISEKAEISAFTEIVADLNKERITVKCGEQYFVLLVKKTDFEAFTRAILDVNPKIDFSYTLGDEENKPKDKKDK